MSLEVHDVFSQAIPGAFGPDFLHRLIACTNNHNQIPTDMKLKNKPIATQPVSQTWQAVYENLKYRLEYLPLAPDECYVDMRLGDLRLIFEHLNDKS